MIVCPVWGFAEKTMTRHTKISYVKSGVRTLAFLNMCYAPNYPQALVGTAMLLIAAEVFGIIEEFGE